MGRQRRIKKQKKIAQKINRNENQPTTGLKINFNSSYNNFSFCFFFDLNSVIFLFERLDEFLQKFSKILYD